MIALFWLKAQLRGHLQTRGQTFAQLYEESIRPLIKTLLWITAGSTVLCVATIIHGAVVLTQMQNQTQYYYYYGYATLLYTGLGAGNLVLGVVGLAIALYYLKRLLDFYRSHPSGGGEGDAAEGRQPMNPSSPTASRRKQHADSGYVEQLDVTDLTDYVAAALQAPEQSSGYPRSSSSQGSDQTFFEYSSEKSQPVNIGSRTATTHNVIPARKRGSSIETDIF